MTKQEIRDIVQEFLHTDEVSEDLQNRLEAAQEAMKELIDTSEDSKDKNEWKIQLGLSTPEGKELLLLATRFPQ